MRLGAALLCCAMLVAPALAQDPGKKLDPKQQAALAKKQKDEAEKKLFMARVTQCDLRASDKKLKGNAHKNFMRDCLKD